MKKKGKVFCIILSAIILVIALFMGCFIILQNSGTSNYSEEQHVLRVRKLAVKRYLGEGSEYTGLEVYPIYNEEEELNYMLIELQPQGFVYVQINQTSVISPILQWMGGVGTYTRNEEMPTSWKPYRMKDGKYEPIVDESGNQLEYYDSHFKVAKIENERRYILRTPSYDGSDSLKRIVAVKRGEQYLNLVDGKLINYEPNVYLSDVATADIYFTAKSHFDL